MTVYTITEQQREQLTKAIQGSIYGEPVFGEPIREALKCLANLQPNTQEPVGWHPTEAAIAALKRFEETCTDNEGYDVPKDTMRNLRCIGLVYRTYGDMYCITDFGQSILTAHGVKP